MSQIPPCMGLFPPVRLLIFEILSQLSVTIAFQKWNVVKFDKKKCWFLTSGPVRQVLAVTFLLLLLLLRVFIPKIKFFWLFKSFIRFILNILEYFLSKLLQICQNLSKLVQTCQNWTKLFQISPNLSKSVQTCSIQFKIVQISLKLSKSVLTC